MFLAPTRCTSTLRERWEVTGELYRLPAQRKRFRAVRAGLQVLADPGQRPGSVKFLHLLHKSQDLRKLAQTDKYLQECAHKLPKQLEQ